MRAFARNVLHRKQKHHHQDGHQDRKVFAHYMVGLTDGQTADEWFEEIHTAFSAGIDGFALNIGPSDPWTSVQLEQAYAAASRVAEELGEFVLFLSFDMAAGEWSLEQVVCLINQFKVTSAQCRVDGLPFVSTFEGPGWAENWSRVREGTGGIFLVPDWSSLGPHGVGEKLGLIDGAFSWCAWPRAGQRRLNTEEDIAYRRVLDDKAYMMGISPWFYTRLPQWAKNWYSSGERLWYDRWRQILELKPQFVQIITWNDFGESSYICDPRRPSQIVPGAEKYVCGHSHAAFRATLPYFIQAYKSGRDSITPERDCAIAWYRTTPATCGPDGGTVWGQGGHQSASQGTVDVISVLTITTKPTTVVLGIGESSEELKTHHKHGHVAFFEVPVDGRTGPVTLSLNGDSASGPPISNSCAPCGHVMYNCTAIHVQSLDS